MTLLAIAILISGCLHIHFDYKNNYAACYIFKPLTILLTITSVFIFASFNELYHYLIVAGLVFSLFGDIFLMLKRQQFIAGLVSFLIAHFIYSAAFFTQLNLPPTPTIFIVVSLVGLAMYTWLWPGLGKLAIPVSVYVAAITIMVSLAAEIWFAMPDQFTLAAMIGAGFFMLSDGVLAANKFRMPFKAAQAIILSTYYIAQMSIAYSAFT